VDGCEIKHHQKDDLNPLKSYNGEHHLAGKYMIQPTNMGI
jgi:hypothetical protein